MNTVSIQITIRQLAGTVSLTDGISDGGNMSGASNIHQQQRVVLNSEEVDCDVNRVLIGAHKCKS